VAAARLDRLGALVVTGAAALYFRLRYPRPGSWASCSRPTLLLTWPWAYTQGPIWLNAISRRSSARSGAGHRRTAWAGTVRLRDRACS